MLAFKKILTRDELKNIEIPEELGGQFEVIILPINDKKDDMQDDEISKAQESNGFSQEVLSLKSEDVWNDL